MNRGRILVTGFIACLLAATALAAGASTASGSLSVGEFAVMIADRMDPDGANGGQLTPEQAAEVLQKAGVRVNSGLSSPLTEAEAAQLFNQFGITLQAANAGALLDGKRAASLVQIFGETLAAKSSGNSPASSGSIINSDRNTGGINLETTIADCQALPRPPKPCDDKFSVCNPCMDCCLNTLGLPGKTCGRACQKKNLVSSPTEPTP